MRITPLEHGRIEYISAFIVAFLVIQVGFSLFKTSVGKILHPEPMTFKWISDSDSDFINLREILAFRV